jgi:hypothetical protein
MEMCVLANEALKILVKRNKFLGGAKFLDDITTTHSDNKYFLSHYETKFDPSHCLQPKSKAQEDQIAFSRGEQRGPVGIIHVLYQDL